MKLLIIICSNVFEPRYNDNIKILDNYMKLLNMQVDYCGISSNNDFHNYEKYITFKYKRIDANKQITKICNFISEFKNELDYDYYMKIRPEIKLLEQINFDFLDNNAVNARARVYRGPIKVKYGMSVNGEGPWKYIIDCYESNEEKEIIIDDQIFIFDKNVVNSAGFNKFENNHIRQDEWAFSKMLSDRKIKLNIIGLNCEFCKVHQFSGHVNIM